MRDRSVILISRFLKSRSAPVPGELCGLFACRAVAVFVLTLAVCVPSAWGFELVRDGLPMCFIVVSPDADSTETFAVAELCEHVRAMTGADLPVRTTPYDEIPQTGRALLFGNGAWLNDPRFAECETAAEMLGDQGYIIRSYEETQPSALVMTGRHPVGTLYAVYHLLSSLGVRWYTPEVTHIPSERNIDLGDVDVNDLPCFEMREVMLPEAGSLWRTRLRLTGGIRGTVEPLATVMMVYLDDLAPGTLFDEHPGLFPVVDGTRVRGSAGRCFAGDELVDVTIDSLVARLDRHQGADVVRIRYEANAADCDCERCRSARERDGANGPILLWAERVADRLRNRYPHLTLELPMRGSCEKPPLNTQPSDMISIMLMPDDVDLRRPFEDSIDERTMAFLMHLRGWRALNTRLTVCHPAAGMTMPMAPFPDTGQLFNSVGMYHYDFVESCLFSMPETKGLAVSFGELKTWVLAELMWDRYRDSDMLVREWIKGVYGNAQGAMRDYWKHGRSLGEKPNVRLTSDTFIADYVDDAWLDSGDRILQRAYALSMTDSTAHRYVLKARLGHRLLRIEYEAGLELTDKRIETMTSLLDSWESDAHVLGCERVSAHETASGFLRRMRKRFK